jgi:hypothetical protein
MSLDNMEKAKASGPGRGKVGRPARPTFNALSWPPRPRRWLGKPGAAEHDPLLRHQRGRRHRFRAARMADELLSASRDVIVLLAAFAAIGGAMSFARPSSRRRRASS